MSLLFPSLSILLPRVILIRGRYVEIHPRKANMPGARFYIVGIGPWSIQQEYKFNWMWLWHEKLSGKPSKGAIWNALAELRRCVIIPFHWISAPFHHLINEPEDMTKSTISYSIILLKSLVEDVQGQLLIKRKSMPWEAHKVQFFKIVEGVLSTRILGV